ncbi:MAG TPA: response regulator, partial [Desulfosalsimonadaceae bacterium]|nr:response regulator [Desulfosalsimonadaceae bacterium]
YTAISAGNGSDALAILEAQADRIDCVITDLSMPEMDGRQILEAVKNRCSSLPVILASGYEESHVMDGRQPASPDAFLQKPYQMAELKAVLGRVMRCGARVPAI